MEIHQKWLVKWDNHHLVGGLEPWNFMTFHILGMSTSQLTKSYFSEGVGIPPTSHFSWGDSISCTILPHQMGWFTTKGQKTWQVRPPQFKRVLGICKKRPSWHLWGTDIGRCTPYLGHFERHTYCIKVGFVMAMPLRWPACLLWNRHKLIWVKQVHFTQQLFKPWYPQAYFYVLRWRCWTILQKLCPPQLGLRVASVVCLPSSWNKNWVTCLVSLYHQIIPLP